MNEDRVVRLLFGGDFAPIERYEQLIAAEGGSVFGAARELIQQSDLSVLNLEAPVCRGSGATMKIGPTIHAAPHTLRALSEAKVAVVCLANNHILDYGTQGLLETLTALDENGIGYVGAGLDRSSAEGALRLDIHERRVSLFAFSEQEFNVSDDGQIGAAVLDPIRMGPLILQERQHADAIIVCVHGGNEYFSYPRPGLRRLCQFLVDIGADAVIGHHPHVPGAYEWYRGKPIVYSLGNLIFDHRAPPPGWNEGYFVGLDLTFNGPRLMDMSVELHPYQQAVSVGGLRLMKGNERVAFIDRIEQMRDQLENHPEAWLAAWNGFVAAKRAQALFDLSSPVRFKGLRRLMSIRFLQKLLASPQRQMRRLNMLRCASHHELLVRALETSVAARQGSERDNDEPM